MRTTLLMVRKNIQTEIKYSNYSDLTRFSHLVHEDENLLVGEAVEGTSQTAHAGRERQVGV